MTDYSKRDDIPFGNTAEEQAEIDRVKSLPEIQDAVNRMCADVLMPPHTTRPTANDLIMCHVGDTENPHVKLFAGVILCGHIPEKDPWVDNSELFQTDPSPNVFTFHASVDGYNLSINIAVFQL